MLVVCEVDKSNFYSCSIINEIAENSTTCQVGGETFEEFQTPLQVDVSHSDQPMLSLDEDIIR